MAVDFARAMDVNARMQNAADAAIVGAISEKSGGVAQAINMSADGEVTLSEEEARELFAAQTSSGGTVAGEAPKPKTEKDLTIDSVKVKVVKTGTMLNAELSYTVSVPTTLLTIIGKKHITVSGKATATYQSQSFMDFYMLLDNTPSMGVAATPTDVTAMIAATKKQPSGSENCAFACHIVSQTGVVDTKSNYFVARNKGITIRIDVVAKAVAALTTTATEEQSYSNQFRMAAYTFGNSATDVKLLKVAALTTDMSQVKAGTADIKLMSIPVQGYNNDQQTSFDDALTKIGKEIPTVGDGSSSAKPQKVLFFVADGVGDSYKPSTCTKKTTSGRCQEPIDVSYCKALKDRGIKIAVLYTTYVPLPTNDWYNTWIKPFQTEIGTKMQACASPGYYFEVSPTQGIEAAMKELFKKVVHTPRLTS